MSIRTAPRFCLGGCGRFEKLLYGCGDPSRLHVSGPWPVSDTQRCVVETGQMPSAETGHMSAVATGQMSAVKTGQMSGQDRCLLLRKDRCLLLREDRCLLLRQGSALS